MTVAALALALALEPSSIPDPHAAALEPIRLDLRGVLARAVENYPEIAIVAAEREGALALASQAHWSRWTPKLINTDSFGVVPGARGDVLESGDSNRELNDYGPFWRFSLDASLPLYTLPHSPAQQATKLLIQAKDAKLEARRATASSLAARAYLGWLRAHESLKLVAEIRGHLNDLIEKLENPDPGEPDTEPLDLFKAKSYSFQLDRAEADARRGKAVAGRGLLELVEPSGRRAVLPAREALVALVSAEPDLESGMVEAEAASPDLREVRSGARARRLVSEAMAKEVLPVPTLEGRFDYTRAPGRDQQYNPFVYEPFNTTTLTAALTVRWDLNFKQVQARSRKERAEALELEAKAAGVATKLRVEVADRHARVVWALRGHEASLRAVSLSANWLRVAEENHGLGTASVKDMVEAYQAWVLARSAHVEAIHDLNLAIIEWRLALGRAPLVEGESL